MDFSRRTIALLFSVYTENAYVIGSSKHNTRYPECPSPGAIVKKVT